MESWGTEHSPDCLKSVTSDWIAIESQSNRNRIALVCSGLWSTQSFKALNSTSLQWTSACSLWLSWIECDAWLSFVFPRRSFSDSVTVVLQVILEIIALRGASLTVHSPRTRRLQQSTRGRQNAVSWLRTCVMMAKAVMGTMRKRM